MAAVASAQVGTVTIDGGATLVSDYRFRGLSRTARRPAIQGNATLTHGSGAYLGSWASTIGDRVAKGGDAELDLIAGYAKTLGGTTIDGGILYYAFPGARGRDPDYVEPYLGVSHTLGPVEAKLGGNIAWKQRGLAVAGTRDAGAYLHGELSAAVPGTGLTLRGHLGRNFVRNAVTFGRRYDDWSLTAAYSRRPFTVSAAYVDTDRSFRSALDGGGTNRPIGGAGIVGSVGLVF